MTDLGLSTANALLRKILMHITQKNHSPLISSKRITTFAEITAEKCDFLHFSALKSVISQNYKPNQRHAH